MSSCWKHTGITSKHLGIYQVSELVYYIVIEDILLKKLIKLFNVWENLKSTNVLNYDKHNLGVRTSLNS